LTVSASVNIHQRTCSSADDLLRLAIGVRSNSGARPILLRFDEDLELAAIARAPQGFVTIRE
jgi:hypothetical protein